jgi:hypothetical protein
MRDVRPCAACRAFNQRQFGYGSSPNGKETICQNELVIHAEKTNLWRVASPVRKDISHARIVLMAMNTASFAGIRSDSIEH